MGFVTYWIATPEVADIANVFDSAILFQRSNQLVSGCKQKIVDGILADPIHYPSGVTSDMDNLITGIGQAVDAGIAAWIGWTPPHGGTLPPATLQAFVASAVSGWTGPSKDEFIGICGQAIYELIMTGA